MPLAGKNPYCAASPCSTTTVVDRAMSRYERTAQLLERVDATLAQEGEASNTPNTNDNVVRKSNSSNKNPGPSRRRQAALNEIKPYSDKTAQLETNVMRGGTCDKTTSSSRVKIEHMIKYTKVQRKREENTIHDLVREAGRVMGEQSKLQQLQGVSQTLKTTSETITEIWVLRPERYSDEDVVYAALQAQAQEADGTMQLVEEHKSVLEELLEENGEIKEILTANSTNKDEGMEVDTSALLLQQGDEEADIPRSPLKHQTWVDDTNELIRQATDHMNRSKGTRTYSTELQMQRTQCEDEATKAVGDSFNFQLEAWKILIKELRDKREAIRAQIEELERMSVKLSDREFQVRQSLLRAEARLLTRQTRPEEECKDDTAEEQLQTEMEGLKELHEELETHLTEMESERERLEDELMRREEELQDTEDVLEVDSECLRSHVKHKAAAQLLKKEKADARRTLCPDAVVPKRQSGSARKVQQKSTRYHKTVQRK